MTLRLHYYCYYFLRLIDESFKRVDGRVLLYSMLQISSANNIHFIQECEFLIANSLFMFPISLLVIIEKSNKSMRKKRTHK